jgi:predicted nucleic acid-binding protein
MYLLDTNVIIDFFNLKLSKNAINFLSEIEPIISVITRIELFSSTKLSETEINSLNSFIESAEIIDHINNEIVNKSVIIRLKHNIKLPDSIIAASALTNNLILITRNISDFNKIDGLKIINPYDL